MLVPMPSTHSRSVVPSSDASTWCHALAATGAEVVVRAMPLDLTIVAENRTVVGVAAVTRTAIRPSLLTTRSRAPDGASGLAHSSIANVVDAASATGHAT